MSSFWSADAQICFLPVAWGFLAKGVACLAISLGHRFD
jgi:hypothetical protein